MKSIICIGLVFYCANSFAAPLTCAQLHNAYINDQIDAKTYTCNTDDKACQDRLHSQLVQTINFYQADSTLPDLAGEYNPYYFQYKIGDLLLEGANIDLGGNGHELLFFSQTATAAKISQVDSDLSVNGENCMEETYMEPYITTVRTKNLCAAIVPVVQNLLPQTTFSMTDCLNRQTRDMDFYVGDFDADKIDVVVSRNLEDRSAWYFKCKTTIGRIDGAVRAVSCQAEAAQATTSK